MALSYPNLPGLEVSLADGGLILPDTGATEGMLIIANCTKTGAPVDPLLVRQSSDAVTNYGDYVDANGVVNPIVAAWKAAFEGGNRRTYLLPLPGTDTKTTFLKLRDSLFGPLADFSIENVVLKDVYADVETAVLTSADFTNADDIVNFPNLTGLLKYSYNVVGTGTLAYPVAITSGIAQVETATVGTTNITTSGNYNVIVTGAGITGSPLTVPVAVVSGVAEVDTLTVTTAPTTAGNVTVTLNGTAVNTAVLATDTTTQAATKIAASTYVGYTASAAGAVVTFTATAVGTKTAPSFAGGTTGAAANIVVTTAGVNGDTTAALVAAKVRTALSGNTAISTLYTVGGTTSAVTLTRVSATANDATLNIELFAASSTAVGSVNVPVSTHTTAGATANTNFIINATVDVPLSMTAKTYDGTVGKTLDDLAADLQTIIRAGGAAFTTFKVINANGKITVLGDRAYTLKVGATSDATVTLKVLGAGVKTKSDIGMIYVGNFAELLRDYCELQTINHNSVKGFIAVTAPTTTSLTDIKANVDRLAALNNQYSGHLSVIAGPELGYQIPGKTGFYIANGLVTYAALVSTLSAESAPTNKSVDGVAGGLQYNMSLRQLNQLSGAKYVSFRWKNGGVYVTDGITTAPDLIIGGQVQPSDFTRLSTLRITHAAINLVRLVSDPFIGEPNGMAQRNALNAAIKAGLDAMKAAGAIQDYRFSIVSDRSAGVLGQSNVTLQLVPAFETRKITVAVSLATRLN